MLRCCRVEAKHPRIEVDCWLLKRRRVRGSVQWEGKASKRMWLRYRHDCRSRSRHRAFECARLQQQPTTIGAHVKSDPKTWSPSPVYSSKAPNCTTFPPPARGDRCCIPNPSNRRLWSTTRGTRFEGARLRDRVCDFHRISNRWVRAGPDSPSIWYLGGSINVWCVRSFARYSNVPCSIG